MQFNSFEGVYRGEKKEKLGHAAHSFQVATALLCFMNIVWCLYNYLLEISNNINRILEEDSNMAVRLLKKEA